MTTIVIHWQPPVAGLLLGLLAAGLVFIGGYATYLRMRGK